MRRWHAGAVQLYSDFAPRRARQVSADVIALALIAGWVWLGVTVHALVSGLATYGRQLEDAGSGFQTTMTDVGDSLARVPIIGAGIRAPFDGASGAGGALASAGRDVQTMVEQLAITVGIGIAVLPIAMILAVWLVPRIRFVRGAGRMRVLLRGGAAVDLLALRALSNQKLGTIAKIDQDAMGAWRRGDTDVMRKLASLELRSAGIRA